MMDGLTGGELLDIYLMYIYLLYIVDLPVKYFSYSHFSTALP